MATSLCALAMVGSMPSMASGEKKIAPGMEIVASAGNDIFNESLPQAEEAAQEIQDLGGNAARIFYPLNKGTAWENYPDSLCNAARAAYDHNLQLIITFDGFDANSQLGFYPTSLTEIKQFNTTAASILWTLMSDGDAHNPRGCVPEQKTIYIEGMNEPNNRVFNSSFTDTATPGQELAIDSMLSKTLKKEASKPLIRGRVYFGEALSAANHDVVGFLKSQGQVAKDKRIKNPYDFIDIHPYPADPTADPAPTMTRIFPQVQQIRDSYFPKSEIDYLEWGVNTINDSYSPPVTSNIGVSEAKQVQYTKDFLATAIAQGVKKVALFKVRDDGGGYMPSSGELYKNGQPKKSYEKISRAIYESRN